MKRTHRLHLGEHFRRLFRRGKRVETAFFRMVYGENDAPHARVAVVVPRTVDRHATVRNLMRRRVREWVRKHAWIISSPLDIAVILKKDASHLPRHIFYEELEHIFQRFIR